MYICVSYVYVYTYALYIYTYTSISRMLFNYGARFIDIADTP